MRLLNFKLISAHVPIQKYLSLDILPEKLVLYSSIFADNLSDSSFEPEKTIKSEDDEKAAIINWLKTTSTNSISTNTSSTSFPSNQNQKSDSKAFQTSVICKKK